MSVLYDNVLSYGLELTLVTLCLNLLLFYYTKGNLTVVFPYYGNNQHSNTLVFTMTTFIFCYNEKSLVKLSYNFKIYIYRKLEC